MALYEQGEGRGLHTPYRQHFARFGVLQRIQPGGIHPQNPVADCTRQPGMIQVVEIGSGPQLPETLTD